MLARVRKWGNSLGVRIPKAIADEVSVTDGSTVEIQVAGGAIVIRPVERRSYSLEELLGGVTPENLHGEVECGPPQGREAW